MSEISRNQVRLAKALPELLLPAGSREKLEAALTFGADAVYLAGERFGLRAAKASFNDDELAEAIAFTHKQGAKAYVTLNIIAHEEDLPFLPVYVRKLAEYSADAVIVSDPGVFATVRREAPGLEIHLSTQASTCNSASCNFWYALGVRRIVLARELSLEEIISIRREVPADLELEAFVHGSMCMAYSGRCLLSNALTGRDANRGECAQPCRWTWRLVHENQTEHQLFIEEDDSGSLFFNSRDLCLVNHIPELVRAGINSFKIEGRMKGSFYAAITAKVYREAIDLYGEVGDAFRPDPMWQEELDQLVHRSYDTGYYFARPREDAKIESDVSYHRVAAVCARVITDASEGSLIACEQRNKLNLGETVDIIRPRGRNLSLTISRILDESGSDIADTRHPTMPFSLLRADLEPGDRDEVIPAGSFIRRLGDKDKVGV